MKVSFHSATAAVCFLLIVPHLACQRDDLAARIETLCESCDRPDIPGGFALAVVTDGDVVFKKGYGFANSEHGARFTTSTVTDFASVAKQFTGFAVATLVHDGRLSLDDEIHSFLPELPDFGEDITVRHLLHHTSGIRDWVGLVKLSGRYDGDAITDEFLMKLAVNQRELNFKPGESFRYSNLGYVLLARIVERVTGQTFREWTHHQIFTPLAMNNTHFSDDYREIVPNRANAYVRVENGRYVNNYSQLEGYGSSSLYSTLDDMIKWMANYRTQALGGPEVWRMMTRPGTLTNNESTDYGFGISINENQEMVSIGHGGSWAGYLCDLSYYPEQKTATILMINRDPAGFQLSGELTMILQGNENPNDTEQGSVPVRTDVELDPDMLSDYVGPYLYSGRPIWIELNDEQLMVRFPGGGKVWIHPEAEDAFFSKDFDARFSFFRDQDGAVDRMVFFLGDVEHEPCPKVSANPSTFVDVEALYGDYYCPEVRTTYSVVAQDDRLILEHPHNEDVLLQQIDHNTYRGNTWWCTEIRVTRDAEGHVIGFKLDADNKNVQGLRFVRL